MLEVIRVWNDPYSDPEMFQEFFNITRWCILSAVWLIYLERLIRS